MCVALMAKGGLSLAPCLRLSMIPSRVSQMVRRTAMTAPFASLQLLRRGWTVGPVTRRNFMGFDK